jgi:tetratricopeptide (TPR) repeat protein
MAKFLKATAMLLMLFVLFSATSAIAQASHPGNILKAADSLFQKQEWKKAKQQYVVYLQDTSVNSLAWNRLGFSNHNMKLYDEALKDYQKAWDNKLTPFLKAIVAQRMARVYAMQGKISESTDWLTKTGGAGYYAQNDVDTMADFKNIREAATYPEIKKKLYAAVYPCSAEPRAHDFDYWIGEWDVYQTATKNLVGHSVVQNIAGDCALLENWTSTQAHNGKSFNYYDTTVGKWEQDWLGSGGAGDRARYINGEYKDGVMTFTNETTDANGNKTLSKFQFFNVDKNTVRQYLEKSTDGGKTYQQVYNFTYVRKQS